jgi:hypothetical protein
MNSKIESSKIIYPLIESIFNKFPNKNIKFNKKLDINIMNQKREINMSDYMFEYINALQNFESIDKNFISLYQYMLYEIPEHDKIDWIDKTCIGCVSIYKNEKKRNCSIKMGQDLNYIYKNGIFEDTFVKYCNKLLELTKEKICVTFLSSFSIDDNNKIIELTGHETVLLSSFFNNEIKLYLYNSWGKLPEEDCDTGEQFINFIHMYFKKRNINCDIEFFDNVGIQTVLYEKYLSAYNLQGYCTIYSLFFVYCIFKSFYSIRTLKIKISLKDILDAINSYIENSLNENTYNIIVSFSVYIKDKYLMFLQKQMEKKNYEMYLRDINRWFFITENNELRGRFKEEYKTRQLYDYKNVEDDFDIQGEKLEYSGDENKESLDVDELLKKRNLLPKGKGDYEVCKDHKECISLECKYSKCMPMPYNTKLEILRTGKFKIDK